MREFLRWPPLWKRLRPRTPGSRRSGRISLRSRRSPLHAAALDGVAPSLRAIEFGADRGENVSEHRVGQDAGIGVVARAMIAVEEAPARRFERVPRSVRKRERSRPRAERAQHGLMRHPAGGGGRSPQGKMLVAGA